MRGHHVLPSHYLWSLNCVAFAQFHFSWYLFGNSKNTCEDYSLQESALVWFFDFICLGIHAFKWKELYVLTFIYMFNEGKGAFYWLTKSIYNGLHRVDISNGENDSIIGWLDMLSGTPNNTLPKTNTSCFLKAVNL